MRPGNRRIRSCGFEPQATRFLALPLATKYPYPTPPAKRSVGEQADTGWRCYPPRRLRRTAAFRFRSILVLRHRPENPWGNKRKLAWSRDRRSNRPLHHPGLFYEKVRRSGRPMPGPGFIGGNPRTPGGTRRRPAAAILATNCVSFYSFGRSPTRAGVCHN